MISFQNREKKNIADEIPLLENVKCRKLIPTKNDNERRRSSALVERKVSKINYIKQTDSRRAWLSFEFDRDYSPLWIIKCLDHLCNDENTHVQL